MSPEHETGSGLCSRLRQVMASAVDLLKNRLDLASVEYEEERLRALDLVVRAAVVCVLGILTLVSATALVVVLLWDYSPTLALAGVTVLYGVATGVTTLRLRSVLRDTPKAFAETRAALEKDARWLRGDRRRRIGDGTS